MHLNDSYPTEFYVSETGYLVIKQDCFVCGHLTHFLLSPEQTKILWKALPDLMKQQSEQWTGVYQPKEDDNV